MNIGAWLRLMRFDKPVGFILLWAPTAWALQLAAQSTPTLHLLVYFFLGTICMRSAGCVINDIADRHIDKHVARTCYRPLATGELSLRVALIILLVLLAISALILLQLPRSCIWYALFALLITFMYPLMKRCFSAPQLVLGFAFSMGIPMAYAATNAPFDLNMLLLFVINVLWIIAYDTTYALIDREDDRRLGVYSTALLFEPYDQLIISFLLLLAHGGFIVIALRLHFSWLFYSVWLIAGIILLYQLSLIKLKNRMAYLQAFNTNAWYGVFMWSGLWLMGLK